MRTRSLIKNAFQFRDRTEDGEYHLAHGIDVSMLSDTKSISRRLNCSNARNK
jgi:hypothetical protein